MCLGIKGFKFGVLNSFPFQLLRYQKIVVNLWFMSRGKRLTSLKPWLLKPVYCYLVFANALDSLIATDVDSGFNR